MLERSIFNKKMRIYTIVQTRIMSGREGIRTPVGLRPNGFQDRFGIRHLTVNAGI